MEPKFLIFAILLQKFLVFYFDLLSYHLLRHLFSAFDLISWH